MTAAPARRRARRRARSASSAVDVPHARAVAQDVVHQPDRVGGIVGIEARRRSCRCVVRLAQVEGPIAEAAHRRDAALRAPAPPCAR